MCWAISKNSLISNGPPLKGNPLQNKLFLAMCDQITLSVQLYSEVLSIFEIHGSLSVSAIFKNLCCLFILIETVMLFRMKFGFKKHIDLHCAELTLSPPLPLGRELELMCSGQE